MHILISNDDGYRAHRPTSANSPVTLTVPEPVGDVLYLNVNGSAKQVTRVLLNVNGTAKEALVKANP